MGYKAWIAAPSSTARNDGWKRGDILINPLAMTDNRYRTAYESLIVPNQNPLEATYASSSSS
jgi:hypothetical protein